MGYSLTWMPYSINPIFVFMAKRSILLLNGHFGSKGMDDVLDYFIAYRYDICYHPL